MGSIAVLGIEGGNIELDQEAVEGLSTSLRGEVLLPGGETYDEARTIWNAMVDRRPGLIVRCLGSADVVRAVNFVREHGLLTAVRSGGHNIAGNAVCEGGVMIDLSQMKSVRMDLENGTVRMEPGATLGDLDNETQAFGMAVPTGINSTTGAAGLTLGGGFGWLSRKHGLTIDSLISADVVTAAGELVRADADTNPDLFWGIRGGGGNFGVVTSFEYETHEVGPEVLAGLVVHRQSEAKAALEFYRDFAATAPDELSVWVVLRGAPPLPFLAEEDHGTPVLAFAVLYAGEVEEGQQALAPLLEWGNPIGTHVGPCPFVAFQQAFDPLLTPGARNYWKSHNFTEISDAAIETLLSYAGNLPSGQSEIFLAQLGGAQGRVAPDATAYWPRNARYVMNVHTRWDDAEDDDRCRAWAREFFDAAAPHASGDVYINFMPEDEPDRVEAAYGGNYERLLELKRKYDPGNMFRLNQNIKP